MITPADARYATPAIEKRNREDYGENALFSVYPIQVNRVPSEEIAILYNEAVTINSCSRTSLYLPVYYITGDVEGGTGRYASIMRRAHIKELHCWIDDLEYFFPEYYPSSDQEPEQADGAQEGQLQAAKNISTEEINPKTEKALLLTIRLLTKLLCADGKYHHGNKISASALVNDMEKKLSADVFEGAKAETVRKKINQALKEEF